MMSMEILHCKSLFKVSRIISMKSYQLQPSRIILSTLTQAVNKKKDAYLQETDNICFNIEVTTVPLSIQHIILINVHKCNYLSAQVGLQSSQEIGIICPSFNTNIVVPPTRAECVAQAHRRRDNNARITICKCCLVSYALCTLH